MSKENNVQYTLVPAWWTVLRAIIILLCGALCAYWLSPSFTTKQQSGGRTTDSEAVITAMAELETDLGKRLSIQLSTIEAELNGYTCGTEVDGTVKGADLLSPINPNKMSDLRDIAASSVVYVSAGEGAGTGFFVNDRTIVTNAHVVNQEKQVVLFSSKLFPKGERGTVIASTGVSKGDMGSRDYAIISLAPQPNATPLPLSSSVKELEPVISSGFPGIFQKFQKTGLPKMILRRGEFIGEMVQDSGAIIYAHSADVLPGNSGGPLINSCGDAIGVNTFIIWSSASENVSTQVKTDFALPAQDLQKYLKDNGISFKTASSCSPS